MILTQFKVSITTVYFPFLNLTSSYVLSSIHSYSFTIHLQISKKERLLKMMLNVLIVFVWFVFYSLSNKTFVFKWRKATTFGNGRSENLKSNQLRDLVRQFSGGFILIEVPEWQVTSK